MFSASFILFDLMIIFKEIRDFSPLGVQNIMHHFIAIFATFSALMVGAVYPLIAASTIFTEISTIVLHIRFYLIKWKMANGNLFLAVMWTFVSLFAYSRMYMQMRVMYM